ncbi:MAG: M48 family metallopeptidase [Candidatus Omnitrophica bacterium]|nr:M48 family metallopeptidase [Candidatus Omnitrophota bacterium]
MRYIPKEIKGNVNISSKSPIKQLSSLLIALTGAILIIYILLGFSVNILAPRLPETVENSLSKLYKPIYFNKRINLNEEKKIQLLLDDITKTLKYQQKYQVYLIDNDNINALALPGKIIVIFSGLLNELDSENELSFVLGHELGHFENKDHLKALGRNVVLFTLSTIVFGQNNSLSNFIGRSLTKAEMKFSQTQETKADLYAVEVLNKRYKHVGGSTDFLKKLLKNTHTPKYFYLFATHPHPENRIKAITEEINQKKYPINPTIPLNKSLKDNISKIVSPTETPKNHR